MLDALRAVAGELDVSVASAALACQLTRPFVTSVIIGARSREQLLDNLRSTEVQLSAEQVKRLDEASTLPSEYPGWMLDWQNRDARGVVRDFALCAEAHVASALRHVALCAKAASRGGPPLRSGPLRRSQAGE